MAANGRREVTGVWGCPPGRVPPHTRVRAVAGSRPARRRAADAMDGGQPKDAEEPDGRVIGLLTRLTKKKLLILRAIHDESHLYLVY